MADSALLIDRVERRYKQGEATLDILRGASLTLWPGQSVALVAPSGSGKSTLLHLAGLLERPDGGEVMIGDEPTASLNDAARTAIASTITGSNALVSPTVNPLNWYDQQPFTQGSPEGQAFVAMLGAAYVDCINAGVCQVQEK